MIDDCGAWNSDDTRTVDMAYVLKNGNPHHIRKKERSTVSKKGFKERDLEPSRASP